MGESQPIAMNLSESNRHTLLVAVHQSIEEGAAYYAKNLLEGQTEAPSYPSNGGFTAEERKALHLLKGNDALYSAMRKVLASCAAGPVFDLFSYLDGVTEPEHGDWKGVCLVDRPEVAEETEGFLHEEFYDAYWDWRKIRPDKTWHLDTLPE